MSVVLMATHNSCEHSLSSVISCPSFLINHIYWHSYQRGWATRYEPVLPTMGTMANQSWAKGKVCSNSLTQA